MREDELEIWVFLVERSIEAGSDIRLFTHEADAIATARGYLSGFGQTENSVTDDDVYAAIEATNQRPGNEEYIVLAPFPIMSHR